MNSILVTGAGGSIGSLIISTLYQQDIKIIAVESDESRLSNLLKKFPKIEPVLLDLRSPLGLDFYLSKVDKVIHTAAYKQVPFLQNHLLSTFHNNSLVTYNLVQSCIENNVDYFLHISTDKAVEPISVLGLSKHLSEQIVFKVNNMNTSVIRMVNVLGSSASVLTQWNRQLDENNKIQITDPEMKRFYITQDEIKSLFKEVILKALTGLIIPTQIIEKSVSDLADEFINHSKDKEEVKTEIIGKRSGDKQTEKLHWEDEKVINCFPLFNQHSIIEKISNEQIGLLLKHTQDQDEASILEWTRENFSNFDI